MTDVPKAEPEHEPDQYLVERVRGALAQDPNVGELHVEVVVTGDRVFLTGSVPSSERRDVLTELAQQVLPGHRVFNQVTVDRLSEPPEVETLG